MKQTLELLEELQALNQRIEQLRRDVDALSRDVRTHERAVEQARLKADECHKDRLEAMKTADATQIKIEQAEQEVTRMRTQLNTTKQQKEYDVIQKSILSHQADIDKWEDEAIEALQAVDELENAETQAAERIRLTEQELQSARQETARHTAEQNRQLDQLVAERDRLREEIRPEVLAGYDRLASSHHDNALAAVKGRICQGCHTQITKQTENRLMRGTEIVHCPSCGRMLFLGD